MSLNRQTKHIVIFASGSGSNAETIIRYFKTHPTIRVIEVISNNPNALVIKKAEQLHIPTHLITRHAFFESSEVLDHLQQHTTDWIILAGFLWLVPSPIIQAFPQRIINIHPSLLPKHGGKGMYGMRVHEAVLQHQEKESGITIHYVNDDFDKGEIIFQKRCTIDANETPLSLAKKIQQLEHAYYPKVIEKVICG